MKDSLIVTSEEINYKSLYNISHKPNLNQNSDNFFFLSDYNDNINTIYTIKNIMKLINNKNYLNINNYQKQKDCNLFLPPLSNNNKIEILNYYKYKRKNKNSVNSFKFLMISNNHIDKSKINSQNFKSFNSNKGVFKNGKFTYDGKSIFSNSILDNACNSITIKNRKKENNTQKENNKDIENINTYINNEINENINRLNISTNKNIFCKKLISREVQKKDNIFINNYFEIGKNAKNIEINSNIDNEKEVKMRKINKNKITKYIIEKERTHNTTNNNSFDENDIGKIGLFSKDMKERKNESIKYLGNLKYINSNVSMININNYENIDFTKFNSEIPIKHKSIEFKLINIKKSLRGTQ